MTIRYCSYMFNNDYYFIIYVIKIKKMKQKTCVVSAVFVIVGILIGCQPTYRPHPAFEKIIVRHQKELQQSNGQQPDVMPRDNDMDYYLRPVTDYDNSVAYYPNGVEDDGKEERVNESDWLLYQGDMDNYYTMPDHMTNPYEDNDVIMYEPYKDPYSIKDKSKEIYVDYYYPSDNDQDFMPPMEGSLGDSGAENYPLYLD